MDKEASHVLNAPNIISNEVAHNLIYRMAVVPMNLSNQ